MKLINFILGTLMNDTIEKLSQKFKDFPGVGERQAKRFVYYLLRKNPEYIKDLNLLISNIKNNIQECPSCYLFFESKDHGLCDVCKNPKTDKSSLLVVEKDNDYENIKKSKIYNGFYFILGGLILVTNKENLNHLRIKELQSKVEKMSKEGLKEIILALSLTPHGEHTDLYLREVLKNVAEKNNIKIVSLGRGLSTGLELEYSDGETIKNALVNRQ